MDKTTVTTRRIPGISVFLVSDGNRTIVWYCRRKTCAQVNTGLEYRKHQSMKVWTIYVRLLIVHQRFEREGYSSRATLFVPYASALFCLLKELSMQQQQAFVFLRDRQTRCSS